MNFIFDRMIINDHNFCELGPKFWPQLTDVGGWVGDSYVTSCFFMIL